VSGKSATSAALSELPYQAAIKTLKYQYVASTYTFLELGQFADRAFPLAISQRRTLGKFSRS
jgi:hypothetical protein